MFKATQWVRANMNSIHEKENDLSWLPSLWPPFYLRNVQRYLKALELGCQFWPDNELIGEPECKKLMKELDWRLVAAEVEFKKPQYACIVFPA